MCCVLDAHSRYCNYSAMQRLRWGTLAVIALLCRLADRTVEMNGVRDAQDLQRG